MELAIALLLLFVGLFLEIKYRVRLYHSWMERLSASLICFIILMAWETINRLYLHIWSYPGPGMIGIFWFGFPLELYLFYFVAPYFSFVVYELIHRDIDKK